MTTYRENLIDRMINLYGYENPIVIKFAQLCEDWAQTEECDTYLRVVVESHEDYCKLELDK